MIRKLTREKKNIEKLMSTRWEMLRIIKLTHRGFYLYLSSIDNVALHQINLIVILLDCFRENGKNSCDNLI